MKIKFCFLLLLMAGLSFAQSKQFIYEYRFKMDSLNRDQSETENMVLLTSPKGSIFYSQVGYVHDSVMTTTIKNAKVTQNNHFDFTDLKQPKISFEVTKSYPDYKIMLKRSIGSTRLGIANDKKIEWKISNEKSKVLGYDVQKATAKWRGRNWVAWFAPEIPLQDGPYEFSGLPGLIVKIEDSKGDHSFNLVATKNITATEEYSSMKPREIPVSEDKFRKLWKEYKEDPVKDMRQMNISASGAKVVAFSFGGKSYTPEEMMKETEKSRKEELKKINNFLELDLYR